MGRLKKYITEEDKKSAQQKWVREYYERNKTKLNKNSMKKYYEGKMSDNIQNNKLN